MRMSTTIRLLVLSLTAFSLVSAASMDKPVFEIRRVVEKPSADSEPLVLLHGSPGNGQQMKEYLNVVKLPALDQSALKAARVVPDPISGDPQVEVSFTAEGRSRFAEV